MHRSYDAADALGFAIRRDIRNQPIREVDRAGARRMWRATCVVLVFLALVLASAWVRLEQIHLGYQIEQLNARRVALDAERRHLLVELESLRTPQRIEALATGQLKLVEPSVADAFVIERVRTNPVPSRTVIAQR